MSKSAAIPQETAAEWVAVEELVPWRQNPKPHENVDHIVDSIRAFGFGDPLVARLSDKEVLAGHGRLKAAKLLGLTHVPVRFLDLDERKAHLYALAANRLAEKSPWDTQMLYDVLETYSLPEAALAGWTGDDLSKLAGEFSPSFDPSDEDEQGQLDSVAPKLVCCPECGHEFDSRDAKPS